MLSVLHGFRLRSLPPISSLRALVLRLDESGSDGGLLIAITGSGTERGRFSYPALAALSSPALLAPAPPPAVPAYARAPTLLA